MRLLHPPVAHNLRTSDTNNLYDLRKELRPSRVLAPRVQRRASLSRFASHRTTTTKASRRSTPTMKTTTKARRVTTPDTDTRRQQQYLWPPSLDDCVPRRGLAGLVATRSTRSTLISLGLLEARCRGAKAQHARPPRLLMRLMFLFVSRLAT
jgi:hypothetical protein